MYVHQESKFQLRSCNAVRSLQARNQPRTIGKRGLRRQMKHLPARPDPKTPCDLEGERFTQRKTTLPAGPSLFPCTKAFAIALQNPDAATCFFGGGGKEKAPKTHPADPSYPCRRPAKFLLVLKGWQALNCPNPNSDSSPKQNSGSEPGVPFALSFPGNVQYS